MLNVEYRILNARALIVIARAANSASRRLAILVVEVPHPPASGSPSSALKIQNLNREYREPRRPSYRSIEREPDCELQAEETPKSG